MIARIAAYRRLALMMAALILAVNPLECAWAQSAEANLRGTAPAGSTVTAKNLATGLVRRTTVSTDGSYSLVGLPSGTYAVDAGSGTQTTVTLAVALATRILICRSPRIL